MGGLAPHPTSLRPRCRFYWKSTPDSHNHAGVKCKMLRQINFPAANFDVLDFCTPALQAQLREARAGQADAHDLTLLGGGAKKPRLDAPPAAAAPAVAEEDDELAIALRLSMQESSQGGGGGGGGGAASSSAAGSAAPAASASAATAVIKSFGLPASFRGFYGAL
jgi:hypothetical protein